MQKGMVHPDGSIPPPPGGVLYKGKNQSLPSHLTRRRHRRKSCACNRGRCCMTSLCSTFIALVVIIGVGALLFWLIVRPKSPKYTVGNVRIAGLDQSALAAAQRSGTLNTETSFTIEARNPNSRIGYYYDRFSIETDVLGVKVGGEDIPPFYQGHDNTTFLVENLKSGQLNFLELTQAGVLGVSQAGAVPLDIEVDVKARVKIGAWKSPKFKIKVRCGAVVKPSNSSAIGTGVGAPGKKCSYKIKFWIF